MFQRSNGGSQGPAPPVRGGYHRTATAMQAGIPFKLVRERFANGEAIKLDLQAQEQTRNGDLANAERTVALAYKKIRHYG